MNRRAFLGSLFGGVAASAAVRTWPFRVFSFPSEIVVPELPISAELYGLTTMWYSKEALEQLKKDFVFATVIKPIPVSNNKIEFFRYQT
jgi:hypothetical protein